MTLFQTIPQGDVEIGYSLDQMHLVQLALRTFFRGNDQKTHPRRSVPQRRPIKKAITDSLEMHNEKPKPLVWTKSADEFPTKIKRY